MMAQQRPRYRVDLGEIVAIVFVLPIIGSVLLGILLLINQGIGWLKHGIWESVSLRASLLYFNINSISVEWKGAQVLIDYALNTETAIALIIYFPLVAILALNLTGFLFAGWYRS